MLFRSAVDDLGLPAVAGDADGADAVHVAHAQVHAAGAGRFAQAVVRVVVMVREHLEPALDQRRRHRLRADVHEAPLRKSVVLQVHGARFDGVEDVLRPRHQQPHDGAALLAHRLQDPFRLDPAQQHRAAAGDEAPEPVHLGARVVERRDAEEDVVAHLAVVLLLHLGRLGEAAVRQDDRLGEAGGAGGEVDGRVVVEPVLDGRLAPGAVGDEGVVGFREGGAVLADVEAQADLRDAVRDVLHAAGEFGAEHQRRGVGEVEAVADFLGGVAVVEGDGHRAGAQHAEVDGQPLQAVHQQDRHLVAALDPAGQQEVREAVRLLVELRPGDLAPERLHG